MKKAIVIFVAALMLLFSVAVPALASQPPGLLGYEGQPGNQGGPQHNPSGQPPGLLGYEGQPGNQGGPQHHP